MVLLLCLIFIGQSMASMTMFYKMTSMQSMSNMSEMSSMTNSHHGMIKVNAASEHMNVMANSDDCNEEEEEKANTDCRSTTNDECCAQECDCLTSGCSTISAFSTILNYTPEIAIASKISSLSPLLISQALTSLYRPPILS